MVDNCAHGAHAPVLVTLAPVLLDRLQVLRRQRRRRTSSSSAGTSRPWNLCQGRRASWAASQLQRARKTRRWLRGRSGTRLGCLGPGCRGDSPRLAARSRPLYAHQVGSVGERADRSARTSPGCRCCSGPRGANPASDRLEPRRKRSCCRNMGCAPARLQPPAADTRSSARRGGRLRRQPVSGAIGQLREAAGGGPHGSRAAAGYTWRHNSRAPPPELGSPAAPAARL